MNLMKMLGVNPDDLNKIGEQMVDMIAQNGAFKQMMDFFKATSKHLLIIEENQKKILENQEKILQKLNSE